MFVDIATGKVVPRPRKGADVSQYLVMPGRFRARLPSKAGRPGGRIGKKSPGERGPTGARERKAGRDTRQARGTERQGRGIKANLEAQANRARQVGESKVKDIIRDAQGKGTKVVAKAKARATELAKSVEESIKDLLSF